MNVLGNSSKRRLSISQRQAADDYLSKGVQIAYDKEIKNAENFGKFFTTIAMCVTLEEHLHFKDKRRTEFISEFLKHCDELYDYIESNTYTTGNSDKPIFDKDYNIEILNRYAERFGLEFDEGMLEY